MRIPWWFIVAVVVAALGICGAGGTEETGAPYLKASDADMQWWEAARFGLFIHWGPVSLKGTEIGWSRGGERRGRTSIPCHHAA